MKVSATVEWISIRTLISVLVSRRRAQIPKKIRSDEQGDDGVGFIR
jgi:hypothetical protein